MEQQPINNLPKNNLLSEPKRPFWVSSWFKIVVALVIVVILGTGIALASKVWDPLWNPFRPSPEKVLQSMFENMKKISSFQNEMDFTMENSNGEASNSLSLKLSNNSNVSDPKSPKSQGKMNVVLGIQGIQVSADISYVMTNKDMFLKLDNVPAIPFLPVDAGAIKGKWIKITGFSDNSEGGNIMEVVNSFNSGDLIFIKKELADEKIGDVKAYHYVVGLEKEGTKELIKQLLSSTSSMTGSLGEEGNIDSDVNKIVDKLGVLEMEYWIGKKDKMLYKSELEAKIVDDSSEAAFKMDIRFSDFGKPVTVKAPESYMDVEELMEDLLGPMMFEGVR